MSWGNPPKLEPTKPKSGKIIQPEDLAGDSESSQQKALFVWAALASEQYPQLKYLFHIPNGGLRDMRTAVNLKAEGVRAGVPDVFLPHCTIAESLPSEGYFGCWIEMKIEKHRNRKNGGCSDDQLVWHKYLKDAGYHVAVCYSWTEARDVLMNYIKGSY